MNIEAGLYNKILVTDAKLCLKINSLSGNRTLDRFFYIISRLGDGSVYFIILFPLIYFYDKPFLYTFKSYAIIAAFNGLLYKLIKNRIKRRRPFNVMQNINRVMPPPDKYSFPSGHSAVATVFCLCTFHHFGFYWGNFAFLWMALVGFSRVYNGVHYPGDVIFGYFLGFFSVKIGLSIIY